MSEHTLYNAIKDKLSPETREQLERQIRYNELTRTCKSSEKGL